MTNRLTGQPLAAKELDKRKFMKNGVLDQKVENEMRIMQKIKHVCLNPPSSPSPTPSSLPPPNHVTCQNSAHASVAEYRGVR